MSALVSAGAYELSLREKAIAARRRLMGRQHGAPIVIEPWRRILRMVALKHRVTVPDLVSACRTAALCVARDEAAYCLRHELDLFYYQIGEILGGRDQSGMMTAIRRHAARINGAGSSS